MGISVDECLGIVLSAGNFPKRASSQNKPYSAVVTPTRNNQRVKPITLGVSETVWMRIIVYLTDK